MPTPEELSARASRGVHGVLGVELVSVGPDRVVLRLEVDHRVHQPYGLLHGGVSALLAESAASIGAAAATPDNDVVGIELNASHVKAMRSGTLTATATPVKVGRRIQVWRVELTDDAGDTVCSARCTLAVLERRSTDPRQVPT